MYARALPKLTFGTSSRRNFEFPTPGISFGPNLYCSLCVVFYKLPSPLRHSPHHTHSTPHRWPAKQSRNFFSSFLSLHNALLATKWRFSTFLDPSYSWKRYHQFSAIFSHHARFLGNHPYRNTDKSSSKT